MHKSFKLFYWDFCWLITLKGLGNEIRIGLKQYDLIGLGQESPAENVEF